MTVTRQGGTVMSLKPFPELYHNPLYSTATISQSHTQCHLMSRDTKPRAQHQSHDHTRLSSSQMSLSRVWWHCHELRWWGGWSLPLSVIREVAHLASVDWEEINICHRARGRTACLIPGLLPLPAPNTTVGKSHLVSQCIIAKVLNFMKALTAKIFINKWRVVDSCCLKMKLIYCPLQWIVSYCVI